MPTKTRAIRFFIGYLPRPPGLKLPAGVKPLRKKEGRDERDDDNGNGGQDKKRRSQGEPDGPENRALSPPETNAAGRAP